MSADSASEVSGPVATITGDLPLSAAGIAGTSSRTMVISGCAGEPRRDLAREDLAVDGQGGAGRHAGDLGGGHHHRVEPAHLFLEQADGVVELVAAERVAAHELGEPVGLVDRRSARPGRISWSVTGTPARPPATPPRSQPGRRR